jgi:histidinol-phosphate/aromatic aminotransferase/cobyric acid decarboxylase-like protein
MTALSARAAEATARVRKASVRERRVGKLLGLASFRFGYAIPMF